MALIFKLKLILFALILISCSSNQDQSNSLSEIWDLYKNQDEEKEIIPVSIEIKNAIEYPFIEVRSNGFIRQILMIPISNRNNITNYISGDGKSLTMDGGLISKTNGMNNWLLSVETNRKSPFYELKEINHWPKKNIRTYRFLNPENQQTTIQFNCDIKVNYEKKLIELAGEIFKVFHVLEDCKNDFKSFQNIYWVEKMDLFASHCNGFH